MTDARLSRRGLLRDGGAAVALGAAGLGAAGLAGTAGTARAASRPALVAKDGAKPVPSDAELIGGLAAVEQLAVFVYEEALHAREPGPRTRRLARQVLGHERAHVQALIAALRRLGAAPPPAPRDRREAERALRSHHTVVDLDGKRSPKDWIRLLADIEDVLERNYHTALSELRRPALLDLCTQIYASEAQHSALLGELLHPGDAAKALPYPFVNGD